MVTDADEFWEERGNRIAARYECPICDATVVIRFEEQHALREVGNGWQELKRE